jgi:hypothetical protein
MYDNTGSHRVEFINCAIEEETFDGFGTVRGVVSTGDNPRLDIHPADTQAGLESFLEEHGDFIAISYFGEIPDMIFNYHIDDEEHGNILSLTKENDTFFKLFVNPNDDLFTGTTRKPVPRSILRREKLGENTSETHPEDKNTIIIQVLFGGEEPIGGGDPTHHIDIVAITGNAKQVLLARLHTDRVLYGTLRKKFSIKPAENTMITSVSFGRIPTSDTIGKETTTGRETPFFIVEDQESVFAPQRRILAKISQAPNKIYNTEVTI